MITLKEARQFFSEEEMSDAELMTVVEEIDRVQLQILDGLKGGTNE
ncbi:MAG: hypothetical protein G01um101438_462 [Parcubacteria group bacterium Gr01-1014_38]|nr:MAG: hypothetical protein G01um101438_462 [Parcubacteria group bacterium Gr01-1014_38]